MKFVLCCVGLFFTYVQIVNANHYMDLAKYFAESKEEIRWDDLPLAGVPSDISCVAVYQKKPFVFDESELVLRAVDSGEGGPLFPESVRYVPLAHYTFFTDENLLNPDIVQVIVSNNELKTVISGHVMQIRLHKNGYIFYKLAGLHGSSNNLYGYCYFNDEYEKELI